MDRILISKAKTNPASPWNLQKWDCFVRYGTRGVSADCTSKHRPAAKGLPAPLWKPACCWQVPASISNGCCFRAVTDRDGQTVFPLGLAPVRFFPLQPQLHLQCQGTKIKENRYIFHSSHTEPCLEGKLKAFLLGYSRFTESTSTFIMILYKDLINGHKPLHKYLVILISSVAC